MACTWESWLCGGDLPAGFGLMINSGYFVMGCWDMSKGMRESQTQLRRLQNEFITHSFTAGAVGPDVPVSLLYL